MVAVLKIIKYNGNNCIFGTEVVDLGLKRIDYTVPAVYNSIDIVPSADASDALRYPILVPTEGGPTHSFETIFKLHLKVAPDNQLSNIRIFPNIPRPSSPTAAKMYIGVSQSYTRPTNNASIVAVNDIWDYTEENPFLITIGGVSGYQISPTIFGVYQYQVTIGDTGSGNKLFLNGNKQELIKIIENNSSPYTFINHVTPMYTLSIFDAATSLPIAPLDHPNIVYGSTLGNQTITITPTTALKTAYPMGFKYGTTEILPLPTTGIDMGSTISWFTLAQVPTETLTFTVESLPDPTVGHNVFYINNTKKPVLDFQAGKIYVFNNISGDIDPIRFVTRGLGGDETNVITTGITVVNGGTVNEVVTVDTTLVNMSGKYPRSYVSTTAGHSDYGNQVKFFCSNNNGGHSSGHSQDEGQAHAIGNHTGFFAGEGDSHGPFNDHHNHNGHQHGHSGDSHGHSNDWNNPHGFHTFPIDNTGFYNMNTIGGGTSDPLNSGETDYIYLQLHVDPTTDPGDVLPELIIRYDES